MQNEFLKADVSEVLRVIEFIKFAHQFDSREKLLETIFPQGGINFETFARVKKYSAKLREAISNYVETTCNAVEKNYVLHLLNNEVEQRYKNEELSQKDQYLNDILNTFFGGKEENVHEIRTGDIPEKCANLNGKYLLFSASQEGRYRVATMRVFYKKGLRSILPVFVTRRYSPETDEGRVRGIMFQSGESVYAAGKVDGTYQFRVSKLNFSYRATRDRTDLYGLRLSHSVQINQPFAYRVYAYQINDLKRYKHAIEYLQSKSDFGGEIFGELDIKIPETIRQKIHGDSILPVGLTVASTGQL